jgi:hypothetical protein
MMSQDCDDCGFLKDCSKRQQKTAKNKKNYCAQEKAWFLNDFFPAIDSGFHNQVKGTS